MPGWTRWSSSGRPATWPSWRPSRPWSGLVDRGVLDVPVVGVAKSGWGLEQFRDYAAASLRSTTAWTRTRGPGEDARPAALRRRRPRRRRHLRRDVEEMGDGSGRCSTWRCRRSCSAGSPRASPTAGRAEGARVMVEKPFGTTWPAPGSSTRPMHEYFPEDAIYRVDHWLGLDPLENVLSPGSPTRSSSRCSTGPRRERPDHHGGGVRRRRPRPVLRQDRRHPRRRAEPHAAGAGHRAGRPARRLRASTPGWTPRRGSSPRCAR
jgi:hypothetical protein